MPDQQPYTTQTDPELPDAAARDTGSQLMADLKAINDARKAREARQAYDGVSRDAEQPETQVVADRPDADQGQTEDVVENEVEAPRDPQEQLKGVLGALKEGGTDELQARLETERQEKLMLYNEALKLLSKGILQYIDRHIGANNYGFIADQSIAEEKGRYMGIATSPDGGTHGIGVMIKDSDGLLNGLLEKEFPPNTYSVNVAITPSGEIRIKGLGPSDVVTLESPSMINGEVNNESDFEAALDTVSKLIAEEVSVREEEARARESAMYDVLAKIYMDAVNEAQKGPSDKVKIVNERILRDGVFVNVTTSQELRDTMSKNPGLREFAKQDVFFVRINVEEDGDNIIANFNEHSQDSRATQAFRSRNRIEQDRLKRETS